MMPRRSLPTELVRAAHSRASRRIQAVERMDKRRQLLASMIATGLLACCVASAAKSDDPALTKQQRIEQAVGRFKSRNTSIEVDIPAISIGIARNGEPIFTAGYGEATPGTPATARTAYRIGSITKQFTAAGILRLIEKGARFDHGRRPLSLKTPVSDILHGSSWTAADEPPILIENLLTMTSRLPNFTRRPPSDLDPWGAVPANQLLGRVKAMRATGFGGSFDYSNTSYFLLSEVADAVECDGADVNFRDFITKDLLQRLHLADTRFAGDQTQALDKSTATPNYHRRPAFSQPDWLKGSGDLISTVSDLLQWNKALMEGRVLDQPIYGTMFSDASRVDVWTYYGMGWFISHRDGVDQYFHSGAVPGYTAFNLIIANSAKPSSDWTSIVILTNSDGVEGIDEFADALAEIARSSN